MFATRFSFGVTRERFITIMSARMPRYTRARASLTPHAPTCLLRRSWQFRGAPPIGASTGVIESDGFGRPMKQRHTGLNLPLTRPLHSPTRLSRQYDWWAHKTRTLDPLTKRRQIRSLLLGLFRGSDPPNKWHTSALTPASRVCFAWLSQARQSEGLHPVAKLVIVAPRIDLSSYGVVIRPAVQRQEHFGYSDSWPPFSTS